MWSTICWPSNGETYKIYLLCVSSLLGQQIVQRKEETGNRRSLKINKVRFWHYNT